MNSTVVGPAISAVEDTGVPALAQRLNAYARLLRPANIVTSAADVLTGFAIAGAPAGRLLWPLLASLALYAGGIVLNDFFDRNLDAMERPERPIPSGLVPAYSAAALGFGLLVVAAVLGFHSSVLTGSLAVLLALCILGYDSGLKHSAIGPVVMGCCRGLNLLLGLAAAPALLGRTAPLALLPLAYVCGITLLSRGEVHGGDRRSAAVSLALFAAVVAGASILHVSAPSRFLATIPFLLLLILRAGVPLWRCYRNPDAARIRAAVHAGVVSLIVLDASLAAGYAGLICGAAILSLSVLAVELAKLFPVT